MTDYNSFYDDIDSLYDAGDSSNDESETFLPGLESKITPKGKKREKKPKEDLVEELIPEKNFIEDANWSNIYSGITSKKNRMRTSMVPGEDFDIFAKSTKKKTRKKEKKKAESDFNAMFRQEMTLLDDLYKDQDRFVSSLDQIYNSMSQSKGIGRGGISKGVTDLIENLNQARTTKLNIIKHKSDLKKAISDLQFKERAQRLKEGEGVQDNDIPQIASNYLSKLIANGRNNVHQFGTVPSEQYSPDENIYQADTSLEDALGNALRDLSTNEGEIDNGYATYLNRNVTIAVVRDSETDYHFVAIDEDTNEECPGYPLPNPELELTFDQSGEVASDYLGRRYKIITEGGN